MKRHSVSEGEKKSFVRSFKALVPTTGQFKLNKIYHGFNLFYTRHRTCN
jgi:hypothetical protein